MMNSESKEIDKAKEPKDTKEDGKIGDTTEFSRKLGECAKEMEALSKRKPTPAGLRKYIENFYEIVRKIGELSKRKDMPEQLEIGAKNCKIEFDRLPTSIYAFAGAPFNRDFKEFIPKLHGPLKTHVRKLCKSRNVILDNVQSLLEPRVSESAVEELLYDGKVIKFYPLPECLKTLPWSYDYLFSWKEADPLIVISNHEWGPYCTNLEGFCSRCRYYERYEEARKILADCKKRGVDVYYIPEDKI